MSDILTDADWCEINKQAIGSMYEILSRDIDCTKYFPSLRSAFVLTADDCDEIRQERTRKKMVVKFLEILEKKKKRTVVEELLRAIRKDKTMPQLHVQLMTMFVETKEEYKRQHGKREATPPQQNRTLSSSSSSDIGPLPPPLSAVDRIALSDIPRNRNRSFVPGPPPSSHNTKSLSSSYLSSNSSGPQPPRPRTEPEYRQEAPVVAPVGHIGPRERYANFGQDGPERNTSLLTTDSHSSGGSSCSESMSIQLGISSPCTLTREMADGPEMFTPSRSTPFSNVAQHGSVPKIHHSAGGQLCNTFSLTTLEPRLATTSVKRPPYNRDQFAAVSISPISGGGDQDWRLDRKQDAFSRLESFTGDTSCEAGDNTN